MSFEKISRFTICLFLKPTTDGFKTHCQMGLPEQIAFAYLDGDFYDSILVSLQDVYQKLTPGGICLIDYYCDQIYLFLTLLARLFQEGRLLQALTRRPVPSPFDRRRRVSPSGARFGNDRSRPEGAYFWRSSAANSSSVSLISAAPTFSSRCATLPAPRIGSGRASLNLCNTCRG